MSEDAELIRKAFGSLTWLLNNARNHYAESWPGLEAAAHEDRQAGLAALERLTAARDEALRASQVYMRNAASEVDRADAAEERVRVLFEPLRRLSDAAGAFLVAECDAGVIPSNVLAAEIFELSAADHVARKALAGGGQPDTGQDEGLSGGTA